MILTSISCSWNERISDDQSGQYDDLKLSFRCWKHQAAHWKCVQEIFIPIGRNKKSYVYICVHNICVHNICVHMRTWYMRTYAYIIYAYICVYMHVITNSHRQRAEILEEIYQSYHLTPFIETFHDYLGELVPTENLPGSTTMMITWTEQSRIGEGPCYTRI